METNRKIVSIATKARPRAGRLVSGRRARNGGQFSELASLRLHLLARLIDHHADTLYLDAVGLRWIECRVIGVVGRHAPIGFKALCERLEMDKSHASRMVARLIEGAWLARHDDPLDQRSFLLSLTESGQRLRQTIYRLGVARNEQWLSVLDDAEREVFAACLDRLTAQARRMLDGEAGELPLAQPAAEDSDAGTGAARMTWIDRRLAEQLHGLLGAALSQTSPD